MICFPADDQGGFVHFSEFQSQGVGNHNAVIIAERQVGPAADQALGWVLGGGHKSHRRGNPHETGLKLS